MGFVTLAIKLLEGFPALQQFLRDVFKVAKEKQADVRKTEKDEFVDDLINDILADPDGLRDDEPRQR